MGSTCLQGSSWSWNWNQKLLSPTPVREFEPQEEERTVTHLVREATSKWLRWTRERRRTEEGRRKPLPLLQHLAQCLLNKRQKRWERRRQSLVAHLSETGAGLGWRILSIHHLLIQWVPLHSTIFVFLIKSCFLSSLVNVPSSQGAVILGESKVTIPEENTHSASKKWGMLWVCFRCSLWPSFAMGGHGQERAVTPETMGLGECPERNM